MKEFSENSRGLILNFSVKYCVSEVEVLNSSAFLKVLNKYIQNNTNHYKALLNIDFVSLFKKLLSFNINEIDENINSSLLINFIEGLYDYWRSLERFGIIKNSNHFNSLVRLSFCDVTEEFNNLILKTYRRIIINVRIKEFQVYRQLPAGVNATLLTTTSNYILPLQFLNGIDVVSSICLKPPFISYTKKNKRDGYFTEKEFSNITINKSNFLMFPVKVGDLLAYTYIHKDYLATGVSLVNLFEIETNLRKPDLIYIYGASLEKDDIYYSVDQENDFLIGVASYSDEYDYFGYMKKMLLTLHNIYMINKNFLPIHGACVYIKLKSGLEKVIVIIGDSGAGKSETLEALRSYLKEDLEEFKVIFDDMGTFRIVDNYVYAYGSEVGAFVRLDDLEKGYALKEMDRAIFTNPNKTNSRLIIPVSNYEDIIKGYKVDIVLYANNYELKDEITIYKTLDEILKTFKEGKRFAKGTTTENGLTSSYFANPFGPHQKQKETDVLLDKYFKKLLENNVVIGCLYTKLGISGYEYEGPKSASKYLYELIKK